jgi:hypothetical protein
MIVFVESGGGVSTAGQIELSNGEVYCRSVMALIEWRIAQCTMLACSCPLLCPHLPYFPSVQLR